jgi:hypothetical protein
MLALCSSGYSQGWRWLVPWRLIGDCTYWPAAGFSSEVRAGVDALKSSPARKWRAMGRIEQTLLDGDVAPTDLRPSLAAPPYQKKRRMFLSITKGRSPKAPPRSGQVPQKRDAFTVGYYA